MGDFVNHLESTNQIPGHNIVSVVTWYDSVAFHLIAVAILELQEGGDPMAVVNVKGCCFQKHQRTTQSPSKRVRWQG